MLKDIKVIVKELRDVEITVEEDLDVIEEKLTKYGIERYQIDCEVAFESCGLDVSY